ncbi:MAG: hypothetical protein QHI48_11610, partial [Bacteroidota bacterium]|nr:hypothetical protein [Bacteroidota bacterium]
MSAEQFPAELLDFLLGSEGIRRILSTVPTPGNPIALTGLAGGLKGLVIGLYAQRLGRQVVFIGRETETVRDVWNDALLVLGPEDVMYAAEHGEIGRIEFAAFDDRPAERAEQLRGLAEQPRKLVVTQPSSAFAAVPSSEELVEHAIRVAAGSPLNREETVRRLTLGGFERSTYVGAVGEFSVRGGILDVYPVGFERPVRIEFLGDLVESIREFDPLSQRSIRMLPSVSFLTALFLDKDAFPRRQTLFDHLSPDAVLFLDEPEAIEQEAQVLGKSEDLDRVCRSFPVFRIPALLTARMQAHDAGATPQPAFNGSVGMLRRHVHTLSSRGT